MSFCEHCEGQRFDRAQVLRMLRQVRRELREAKCDQGVDEALATALKAVRDLEIPHLYFEPEGNEVVH
ncbi:MAG: hypothetical protein AB7H96_13600 [Vicinamibacterales bacterium]